MAAVKKNGKKKWTIVGIPFDNGIRSMLRFGRGITGAASGPQAVFHAWDEKFSKEYPGVQKEMLALASFDLPVTAGSIDDSAFHKKQKAATLEAHKIIEGRVKELCGQGLAPLCIGGDHSIAYPIGRALRDANPAKKIGVIYIDAHFDMRALDADEKIGGVISSGNAFRRILEDPEMNVSGENMAVIGIHRSDSEGYRDLEEYAASKKTTVIFDNEIDDVAKVAERALAIAGKGTDLIYFSVDIDAVNKKYAPGVSAPNDGGMTDVQMLALAGAIAADKRVAAVDIAEVSSRELSWQEARGAASRNESKEEREEKLRQTAELAASAIARIIGAREDQWLS